MDQVNRSKFFFFFCFVMDSIYFREISKFLPIAFML